MTKMQFSASFLAVLIISTFTCSAAFASDGTINITGTVTSGTCAVTGSGTGSAKTITVALPSVQTSALAAAGQVAAKTGFQIQVTGCGSGVTKATTYFEPSATVNATDGNLTNIGGTATLVEVQLLNGSGASSGGNAFTPIVLSNATTATQNSGTYAISGGNVNLNYYAQYYATGASTAGSVSTSTQFTMLYQ